MSERPYTMAQAAALAVLKAALDDNPPTSPPVIDAFRQAHQLLGHAQPVINYLDAEGFSMSLRTAVLKAAGLMPARG